MEKQLNKAKDQLNNVVAPANFEEQLEGVLETVPARKQNRNRVRVFVLAATLFIAAMFVYQFPALAYYSKQLLGYDLVMNGTLQQLNEDGMGQIVNETFVLHDGTVVTIDGIMSDKNQFILFYTLKGNQEEIEHVPNPRINGFLIDEYMVSSIGSASEDSSEWKVIAHFHPIHGFAKKLTISFDTLGETTVAYNANEAMQTKLKLKVQQKITTGLGNISFDSLIATPTQTVISGKLSREMARYLQTENIQLYVNGQLVEQQGASISSNIFSSFSVNFDALPEEVTRLSIVVSELPERLDVNQTIDLPASSVELGENTVKIGDVKVAGEQVHMEITTDADVFLEDVALITKDGRTPISETIHVNYLEDDTKKRTIVFEGVHVDDVTALQVGSIRFMQDVHQTIDVLK